jgi:predicted kinase
MGAAAVRTTPLVASAMHDGAVLLVVGGLPGSGKTTLMRRLLRTEASGTVGLDSEQVTARLREAGVRLPYRLLRPFVHGWHRWRVLRTVCGAVPVVVLTDPWTSERWRRTVLCAARRAGRSVHLLLLDASPELASSGQTTRGRALPARAMRRHERRWVRLLRTLDDRDRTAGHVLVVDRAHAAGLTLAEVLGRPVP